MVLQTLGLLIAGAVLVLVLYLLWTTVRQRRRSLELLDQAVAQARETMKARREEIERRRRQTELSWTGHRKFEVARREVACGDEMICSFYLVPHDKRSLPSYRPGQFLTFQFDVPDERKPVVRCYSLSDAPDPERYRISVKRLPAPKDKDVPPGLASNYLHDHVAEGDILDVKAPSGQFYLDETHDRPVVLIGGGVGVTPMLSMLNHVVSNGSNREVHFFHGVSHGGEQMARGHVAEVEREHENVHVHICYSRPRAEDVQGRDFDHEGRVTVELFKEVLPSSNFEYYICGPPPMMSAIFEDLREWGVPESDIKFEAFGPATVKKRKGEGEAESARVTFANSDKTVEWSDPSQTLLELAEEHGVPIDFGCRVGNCHTCLVATKEGEISYITDPDEMPEEGSCLTCIGVPEGDVVLDA